MAAAAASVVRVPGPRRPRPRLVPAQAGPEPPAAAGNPLVLGRSMRAQLLGAVRALIDDPALAGASDGARLASVVLMAKASVRDGYRTCIWAEELGRWLGVSQSQVAHTVLPELRRAGVVGSKAATNEAGHVKGLECWVVPLYRAQRAGNRQHPLALSRSELATLLRLCEALFGPGWTHRDGSVTPAGLLAGRTGRGAATDRLGLLLMVLSTNSAGWLRLCPGTVDSGRGRPAATVARLLGCSLAAGAKVLKRLEELGPVRVERRVTGSGLNGRSRVCLVPIAEARGAATAAFSDLAATASGDLETGGGTETRVNSGASGAGGHVSAGLTDLTATAQHHASHASVADVARDGAVSDGFSGEAPSGYCDRPECACPREDRAAGVTDSGRFTPVGGSGGPLRGDKLKKFATIEQAGDLTPGQEQQGLAAVAELRVVAGEGSSGQRQGRLPRPPRDLETLFGVLGVVGPLWARLERSGARHRVVQAARRELAAIADVAGPAVAEAVLADRLARRLAAQGGPTAVTDPVGWLIGRGLPRRAECADPRCDEGQRLDKGGPCETCGYLVADRRGLRRQVAEQVDTAMSDGTPQQRRVIYEQQLREAVARQLAAGQVRREQAEAVRERRRAAMEQARAAAEAAERARAAQPCAGCGKPASAGRCEACANRDAVRELIGEAALMAAASAVDLAEGAAVEAVRAHAEATIRAELDQVLADAAGQGATEDTLALLARLTAENGIAGYRERALALLTRSEAADTEARMAYEAAMRSAHRYPSRAAARQAATDAAKQARQRAARYLLDTRITALRATGHRPAPTTAGAAVDAAEADPYAAGAARVRAALRAKERTCRQTTWPQEGLADAYSDRRARR
jgi:hypothetical protein